jgi:hypothetical protein
VTNAEGQYRRLQLVAEVQPGYGVGAGDEQRQQGQGQDTRGGNVVVVVKAVGRAPAVTMAGGAGSVGAG